MTFLPKTYFTTMKQSAQSSCLPPKKRLSTEGRFNFKSAASVSEIHCTSIIAHAQTAFVDLNLICVQEVDSHPVYLFVFPPLGVQIARRPLRDNNSARVIRSLKDTLRKILYCFADAEKLTQGLQAILPYVDDFLPAHNLESLESLARELAKLDSSRPTRRQQIKQTLKVFIQKTFSVLI